MIGLLLIGVVAGIIAGISPCILPVLPIVLVGAAAPSVPADASAPAGTAGPSRRRRPLAIVAGLVLSFSLFTLAGTAILSALGLPDDFLRDAGLVVLGLFGLTLLVPALGHLAERPFARLAVAGPSGGRSGFVLGLGLGAVFTPCAGPVLSTIIVVGNTRRVGWSSVGLTVAFGLGVAVPLLIVALAGSQLANRVQQLRARAPGVRRVGGIVLIVMTVLIGFNVTDGLQTSVPGYTSALQNHVEGGAGVRARLAALARAHPATTTTIAGAAARGDLADCTPDDPALAHCGAAPDFEKIAAWFNTVHDRPLSIAGLRGKVVLVDFWTYSCINCQRALKHVEAWYARYKSDGFVVVGVHTPEFAFEHVVSNVHAAIGQLGVHYPVAVDDDYATWTAYDNEYWPADYLIDATGEVRYVSFGEGAYNVTEDQIRALLRAAHPGLRLPEPTEVANRVPEVPVTPESYLGTARLDNLDGPTPDPGVATRYEYATPVPLDELGFSGVWTFGSESDLSGPDATLALHFEADDVYLVLGGRGTITAVVDGRRRRIVVSGIPRLYTMYAGAGFTDATLVLHASPGIRAYDFTFG